jgi:LAO/AO transport system kinase
MLGLRGGNTLKNVPAHHGVDLGRALTRDEKLAMNPARAAREAARDGADNSSWTPPVLRTVASASEGIADVVTAIDRHFGYLERSGILRERRRARLRDRVVEVVEGQVRRRLWRNDATNRWLDARLAELENGTTNPFAVANELLERSANILTVTGSAVR